MRTDFMSAGGFRRSPSKRTLPDSTRPGCSERLTPETRSPSATICVDAHVIGEEERARIVYWPGETLLKLNVPSEDGRVVRKRSNGESGKAVSPLASRTICVFGGMGPSALKTEPSTCVVGTS